MVVIGASKTPTIRVGIDIAPKEFTIGSVGDFAFLDGTSGKELWNGNGEVKCFFNGTTQPIYSIFIDNFYSFVDATNFGCALLPRFTEGTSFKVFLENNFFKLELGEFSDFSAAEEARKDILKDIPKSRVISSPGSSFKVSDGLALRPRTDKTAYTFLKIAPKNNQMAKYRGKRYRGSISLVMSKEKLVVVNTIDFEDYLKGVVPAEMPSSWHPEALKSQAIAARTYAIRFIDKPDTSAYDICADTGCQVYAGFDKEIEATNKAISDTFGQVAVFRGKPIDAVFHSSSGGYTENSEFVFSTAVSYLKGVPSTGEEESPKNTWFKVFPFDEFNAKIKTAIKEEIGDVIDWKITKSGVSGRMFSSDVIGTKGKTTIGASKMRNTFGLLSTWFDLVFIPDFVVICGRGWGHGVGMPQYGAKAMAQTGKKYIEILKHYYQGIEIVKWY